MAISLVVTPPNGSVILGPHTGYGMDPATSYLPPNGTVNTTVVDNTLSGSCIRTYFASLLMFANPDTPGNWTFTPYVQYFYGSNGYSYQGEMACIDRPITSRCIACL